MGIFKRRKNEVRADPEGHVLLDDPLLKALLGNSIVDKDIALQVPTVSGAIDLISNVVASTPIKLYRDEDDEVYEVDDDIRTSLLNNDTESTLTAAEFWRAMIRDYFLGKGGYAYINKVNGEIRSLHYVDEAEIFIQRNTDPIFKDFDIFVQGKRFAPFDFLKLLRNTKDGAEGRPITKENSKLIEVAYESLRFESNLVKRGGNKKGFLKSENKIDPESMSYLRGAFARLYSNSSENMVVLNKGIDFKESSDTSTEMQLNENKVTNANEFAKIFHISADLMAGKASQDDVASFIKLAVIPLMASIESMLNRDLLLEKEKGSYYFAFDTKELLKGDMKERFEAYKTALDANFMQIDEVRYAENLEPLGLTWVKLGLQDVLYDPESKMIYTPNTNKTSIMDSSLPSENSDDSIDGEVRANKYHDSKTGRFASKRGTKSKYSPSPRRNHDGMTLKPKEYSKICSLFNTRYPDAKPEDGKQTIYSAKHQYKATADGYGGLIVHSKIKIR